MTSAVCSLWSVLESNEWKVIVFNGETCFIKVYISAEWGEFAACVASDFKLSYFKLVSTAEYLY